MKRRVFPIMIAALLLLTAFAGGTKNALATEPLTIQENLVVLYDPDDGEYLTAKGANHNETAATYADEAWSGTLPHAVSLLSASAEARYETAPDRWAEGSFADAVDSVCENGVIELLQDVYLTQTITLSKSMTITSADRQRDPKMITCAIDGHEYLLIVASGTLTLTDVAIDGGYDANAETKIYGQRALISVNGGALRIENGTEIRNNYNATPNGAGGGVCLIDGSITMNGGRICGNYASTGGGVAILNTETNLFRFAGGSIDGNTAVTSYKEGEVKSGTYIGWYMQTRRGGFGGGISIAGGTLEMTGGTIKNNTAQPVDLHYVNYSVTPNERKWYTCTGGYGGAIGMYNNSNLKTVVEITDGVIEGNQGFLGGAIYTGYGTLTVKGTDIRNNRAISKVIREEDAQGGYSNVMYGGHGGGVYLENGSLTMTDSSITGNSADYYGGGIYQIQGGLSYSSIPPRLICVSVMELNGVKISGNTARACAGMFINGSDPNNNTNNSTWGSTKLIDTEVAENSASLKGGGVLVAPFLQVAVSGSVKVHENEAPDHKNFLLDNDLETAYDPGVIIVEGVLSSDALIYADVCEHTTPYREVKQLIAAGTSGYTITAADFVRIKSDNERYVTLHDEDSRVYLVPPNPKVTFNPMGGSAIAPNPVEVPYNTAVEEPTEPGKAGYTFDGWYTSTDDGLTLSENAYVFSSTVTEDFVLYAKWKALPDIKKPIVFRVVNGTWADGSTEDILIQVPLTDAEGYPDAKGTGRLDIPTGMKPFDGYDPSGYWDITPTEAVSGTESLTYTFIFAEKPPEIVLPETGDKSNVHLCIRMGTIALAGIFILLIRNGKKAWRRPGKMNLL